MTIEEDVAHLAAEVKALGPRIAELTSVNGVQAERDRIAAALLPKLWDAESFGKDTSRDDGNRTWFDGQANGFSMALAEVLGDEYNQRLHAYRASRKRS